MYNRSFIRRGGAFIHYGPEFRILEQGGGDMVNQLQPDRSGIAIRLVRAWEPDEIADLYRMGGWWRENWDASELPRLIRGSYAFAVAIDEKSGRAVGMGRVLSDGVSDAYIQDVVVDPVFRHQGIGCMLVAELLTHCLSAGIAWIGCIATPQTAGFYRELGFVTMNDYTPMLYGGGGGDLPL